MNSSVQNLNKPEQNLTVSTLFVHTLIVKVQTSSSNFEPSHLSLTPY